MPHEPLEIALEHHRAGRLTRAEAGYRALLAQQPDHADALHWLGVLLFQAGQIAEAVMFLERAAARRPQNAAFQHNLGQAYLAARRHHDAIIAFKRSSSAGADTADLHLGLGVALLRTRRFDEAITSFHAALANDRDFAAAYYHLALAHRARNEPREVRKALNKAIECDRRFAAAWQALGELDRAVGNLPQAEASFRKARELGYREPDSAGDVTPASSWPPSSQQRAASVEDLERRLTPDDSMRKLHDVLADAVGLAAPASLPRAAVAELFDRYADGFDTHLRDKLGYRVPEMIAAAVAQLRPTGQLDVLDLGCGTGLCGRLLRPLACTLAGVDLSPAMIEKARARGVYDRLEVADLVEALVAAPRGSFDLLVAADVLNYIGDLGPTMEAAAAALRPGGLFIFSVEAATRPAAPTAGESRFHFRASTHRYAHADGYVRHVARIHGLDVRVVEQIVVRTEAHAPVGGYLVTIERAG